MRPSASGSRGRPRLRRGAGDPADDPVGEIVVSATAAGSRAGSFVIEVVMLQRIGNAAAPRGWFRATRRRYVPVTQRPQT